MGKQSCSNLKLEKNLFGELITVNVFNKENSLIFSYKVVLPNKIINGTIEVIYEFCVNLTRNQIELMRMGVSIFLAQLFLSKKIQYPKYINKRLVPHYNTLIKLLYNIRNYTEGTNVNPPNVEFQKEQSSLKHDIKKTNSSHKYKAVNLISGGKDSAIASILLEKNGYEVINCFISGFNLASGNSELISCKKIYGNFNIIHAKGFDKLIDEITILSCNNGKPPLNNNMIPCGRDLLSILFSLPLAVKNNANFISVGNERDVWKNNIEGKYGPIPIHDTQSELAIIEINKIIKIEFPDIHLFSPIAGISEIKILSWLFANRPDIISNMSSCFHGEWCGTCWKCTRYYLIQQFVGTNLINFQSNPLQPVNKYLKKYYNKNLPEGTPYMTEILFLLKNLQNKEIQFHHNNEPKMKPDISSYSSNDLFRTHSACLIPARFQRKL